MVKNHYVVVRRPFHNLYRPVSYYNSKGKNHVSNGDKIIEAELIDHRPDAGRVRENMERMYPEHGWVICKM
jgi:hypothetical protein